MPLNRQPTGPIAINKDALKLAQSVTQPIVDATRAYVEADVNVPQGQMVYTFQELKDEFAKVGVGAPEGGGYYVMLKKVHGIWVVVCTGQDLPGKDVAQKYGLPPGWYSTEY